MARGALAGVIMRWGFSDHEKSGRLEALEERLEWALRHPRATAWTGSDSSETAARGGGAARERRRGSVGAEAEQ